MYRDVILLFAVLFCCGLFAADDIVIADFEGGAYPEGWVAGGTAFGSVPAAGAFERQQRVTGFEGKGLVNSYLGTDKSTGTLTSPQFKIERRFIKFLIGGGNHPSLVCINLLIEGKVVRTHSGPDDEKLRWAYWDVSELAGRTAKIEIVDNATGRWGHINIDNIIQSDKPAWYDMEITIKAEKKYLNMPVDNQSGQHRVFVYVDDKVDYYFDLELANPQAADFWVYMDISRYKGKSITFKTRRDSGSSPDALNQLYQSDEPKEAASFYKETNRPQFHFTSRRGWLNDANGVLYYKGEYHLFYQHNPYGWKWGNMHWGHAVSRDLIHWTELGDALLADELGTMYSGSGVVDFNNTAGFKDGEEMPIVLIYTAAGSHSPLNLPYTQCIAYSNDRGRTFTKYQGNPVVEHIISGNRDPKVIWHQQSGKWIMALFLDKNDYCLLSSPDLKSWQRICDITIEGVSECPDFFPLALDGTASDTRWVFWGGNGTYVVGSFDGTTFTPQTKPRNAYAAGNAYAGQSFSDIPEDDGRRIHIPWLRDRSGKVFAGMPFNQQMGLPVVMRLKTFEGSPVLFSWPVKEIENIYKNTREFKPMTLKAGVNPLDGVEDDMLDIYAEFEITDETAVFGFEIRGEKFIYDCKARQIVGRGVAADISPAAGKLNMRIIVDRTSMEFFACDGLIYMPFCLPASDAAKPTKLFSNGGSCELKKLVVHDLEKATIGNRQ